MQWNPTDQDLRAIGAVKNAPEMPHVDTITHATLRLCGARGWVRQDKHLNWHLTPEGEAVWRSRR